MTFSKSKKAAPWFVEQPFSSFTAGLIAFLVTFSLFAFGAVDLWAQTVIHASLWLLLLYHLCGKNEPLYSQSEIRSLLLWIVLLGLIGFSALHSGAPERSRQEWWQWADYFLMYILGQRLNMVQRSGIVQSIFIASLLLCFWGWFEFLAHHQLPEGSLLNSNIFAGYLLLPIFLATERWTHESSKPAALLLIVFSATLLLTKSFGALASLFIGELYLLVRFKAYARYGPLLGLVAVGAFLVMIFKFQTAWDIHRLSWWHSCLQMTLQHPWRGNGPGTFDIALPRRLEMNLFSLYAHNSWLQWICEIGLLGFIGILILLYSVFKNQNNAFRTAGLIAVLCHNTIDYSLLIPAQGLLFWLIASFSNASTPAYKEASTPIPAWKWVLSLFCLAATWQTVNFFQADRRYVNAVHFISQKEWPLVEAEAQATMNLNSLSSKPYALLASIPLLNAGPLLSRSSANLSLAYNLSALDHEPIQPAYWAQAFALFSKLSLPEDIQRLRDQLRHMYPFLLHDRRIQPYLT
jgi:O-antigen ligase